MRGADHVFIGKLHTVETKIDTDNEGAALFVTVNGIVTGTGTSTVSGVGACKRKLGIPNLSQGYRQWSRPKAPRSQERGQAKGTKTMQKLDMGTYL